MRVRAAHLLASVMLIAACGGRYVHVEDDDGSSGSGGSGQAGSKPAGKAGQSSKGGSSSTVGGTSASGGTSSSSGGKTGGCICPDIDIACPPGYVPGPDPNGCCYTCVPLDCRNVACPGIACDSSSHLEYPPDQCCPVCVPGNCEQQRRDYSLFRNQVIERYSSLGCMTHEECSLLYEGNACSSSCGIPVPAIYVKEITVTLDSYAAMACSICPAQPTPPCDPGLPAGCFNGRCGAR